MLCPTGVLDCLFSVHTISSILMKYLCVYCASSAGTDPAYVQAASKLGSQMASAGWGLVYGGAQIGLMGAVADAVLAQDGEAIGILPGFLSNKEVAHKGLTSLQIVPDMHQRKALMAEKADAFLVLPGGIGTLEELFEILTWAQLKLHNKPIVVVNQNGYYDLLLAFMDHQISQGFLKPVNQQLLWVEPNVEAAFQRVQENTGDIHTSVDLDKI